MNWPEIKLEIPNHDGDTPYAKYLKGKRVALIAAGPHLTEIVQGVELEKYDVIVRVNKALPVPQHLWPHIGRRTDIFYNCLNMQEDWGGGQVRKDVLNDAGVKWVCCPYGYVDPFRIDIFRWVYNHPWSSEFGFHAIDTEYYKNIAKTLDTRINSGFGAFLDLISYDIKEIYCTGFTFYLGGFYKEYRNKSEKKIMEDLDDRKLRGKDKPTHCQKPQIGCMKYLLENDSRIKVDQVCKDIIYEKIDVSGIEW